MPFDPDELADGMMKWLEHGRNPKPAPAEPKPSPPPAEMPGSGLSIEELQAQIKALQEQLKEIRGNADIPMAPRDGTPGEPRHPLGPGRDAPKLTPEQRLEEDFDAFNRWRQGSGGEPRYAIPRRPGADDGIYVGPEEKPRWENLPYIQPEAGGTPPQFENLPYKRPENPYDNPNIQLLKGLKE